MKKIILILLPIAFLWGMLITGCTTPAEKVEKAEEEVQEANKELDEAKEDYLKEIEIYREENAKKIEANKKSIEEFRSRIKEQKTEARADYERRIAELEAQNTDIQKDLDNYKAEGREKWEIFKEAYNRNMEKLMRSIVDFE
jgi:F0F1-type ATP synthase membrane subunit b/b'